MPRRHLVAGQRSATPYLIARRISGTPAEVAAAVALLRQSGRLVAMTVPRQYPGDLRRVWVDVHMHAPATRPAVTTYPHRRRLVRRRRWLVAAGAAAAAVVVVVGVVWLAVTVVAAVVAVLPVIVGALVVLGLAWLALGRAGVCCPGLHCPGCKH